MPQVAPRAAIAACLGAFVAVCAHAQPVPTGPALDLTGSASGAILADVEPAPSGGFLVAWYVYGTFPNGIAARTLDPSGRLVGPIQDVWTFASSQQGESPTIAVDATGATLVAWSDGGTYNADILVRRTDPLGPVHVASGVTGPQDDHPAIVAGAPGRFLVVWSSGDSSDREVLARWVDADAQPLGDVFRVNDDTVGYQDGPDVARLADGTVAVVWRHFAGLESRAGIRIYGPDGASLGPARLLPTSPGAELVTPTVRVATAPQGFVVGWVEERVDSGLIMDRFIVAHSVSANGTSRGTIRVAPFQNVPYRFDLAVDENGLGVLAWETDLGGEGIRAAAFDVAAGTASAAVFVSKDTRIYAPVVAPGGPGTFLVAWSDAPEDSIGTSAVVGRLMSLCGNGTPEPGEACDDGNRRDGDCCSSGCKLEPIAGTCWRVAGTSVLTFTASVTSGDTHATCVGRCRASAEGTVMLLDDGTYRWPQGASTCVDGSVTLLPDEIGRRSGKGRTVRLHPRNLPELRAAVRNCSGARLGGLTTTLRLVKDTIIGRQITRLRHPGNPPVSVRATTRFNGLRLEAAVNPLPPDVARRAASCEDDVTLHCRAD